MFIEYDKTNIDIISCREDLVIDLVTCPIDREISISNMSDEDNVFDINKYFLIRSVIDDTIFITYNVLYDKCIIFKVNADFKILQTIILIDILILIGENCNNILIHLEKLTYSICNIWNDLLQNSDDIFSTVVDIHESNDGINIIKTDIELPYNSNKILNKIINFKNIKYKCSDISTITLSKHNHVIMINNIGSNTIIINNKYLQLYFPIVDIFNFSLDHIILVSKSFLILLNLNKNSPTYMQLLEFSLNELIIYINTTFYNKIKSSFYNES